MNSCRYELAFKDRQSAYPKVKYISKCGYELIIYEGYIKNKNGERGPNLNFDYFHDRKCRKCGKF